MDIRSIDLNLLVAFDAMARHRSVTRAAEAMGLSQPAMSAAVARLRRLFDDPLFVRGGGAMQLTARAESLTDPVRRVIGVLEDEILRSDRFDPARTDRRFTIVTPDIGEINFVPRLLDHLSEAAPGARLRAISRPRAAAAETLERGAAELAIGYYPDLQAAGFLKQKLFDMRLVCMARAGHPASTARLSLADYLVLPHAEVRPDGREHVLEQFLAERGLARRVVLELAHFMTLLPVLERSDLIATVPRDLAELCRRYARLAIFTPPIAMPSIPIHQIWHRRVHKDPATVWLRGIVRTLFGRGRRG